MEIAGATALVTGASSGIGASVARSLAAAGARVALVARRADRLAMLAAEIGGGAAPFACDVRDPGQIAATVEAVGTSLGPVDLLVNNAGVGRYLGFLESGPEDVAAVFETNLHAALHFTREVLPGMLARRRGYMVNVASIAGRIGSRNHTIYCASKFALAGFSESLALELDGTGVGVTLVNPGIIDTPFFDHASFVAFPPGARARAIPPERVAAAVVRAVTRDLPEVTVPATYAIGAVLKAAAPRFFRRVMRRFA
ncbi:MAG: SDR family NAD(P)-dependent oxidoreductase [Deltaproteobacteria bacterium]|nr:SDR family NAD(P)-dependent oxidoreductase [Deltaproteobacteria bacterium]